jgi:hypothetical protein
MNAIHVQMMNQQDLIKVFFITMNFNLMDIYINKNMVPHKQIQKKISMIHSKYLHFNFFGENFVH